jgi:signal transduction histidine kinase
LEFRVRLFNVLAFGGAAIGLLTAVLGVVNHAGPVNVTINFLSAVLAWALLVYSRRSGRYQICYMITVVGIFIVLFPAVFFSSGGYHSGMPAFFVFAVVFTVFMLEGKKAAIFSILELLVYTTCCLVAYTRPETVNLFSAEVEILTDIIAAFVTVSIILGASMFIHFRLYNQQQKKLDEQNRILEGANRMKTELFANVSHEMKTPLTVISVHIQRAEKLFEMARDGDEAKIRESFALAQDEIMRMSRLVNNALKLASMQETGNGPSRLDMAVILRTSAEAYVTLLESSGNALERDIPESLPAVTGSTDAMVQIVSNLLSNANNHTKNGVIRVKAAPGRDTLTITVEDNGEGISDEIRAHIFERGVTDGSGSGYGLAISRELARSHGGDIIVESERGKGTSAILTLPVDKEAKGDA